MTTDHIAATKQHRKDLDDVLQTAKRILPDCARRTIKCDPAVSVVWP